MGSDGAKMRYRHRNKAKALFALPLLAVLAIPGAAQQGGDTAAQSERLFAAQGAIGLTLDPHAVPALSLELPSGFTTLDPHADPFAG